MSVVTGVVLISSCCEDTEPNDGPTVLLAEMNTIVASYERPDRFKSVSEKVGGGKHPQMEIIGGGFNHFSKVEDALVQWFMERKWNLPHNAVLIVQPEDGETKIYRGQHEKAFDSKME